MKRFLALALSLSTVSLAGTALAAPTEVSHFVADGESASLSTWDNGSELSLWVERGGTAGNAATYLSFYASSCEYADTSFTCTGLSGWGLIPNGDFDVQGQSGNADLSTDLANLDVYGYSYTCNYITWSCSFDELPAPTGVLSASWDRNAVFKYKENGRMEIDYLNYKFTSQGQYEYTSADADAIVAGQVFSGNGTVGTSRGRTMSIVKNY